MVDRNVKSPSPLAVLLLGGVMVLAACDRTVEEAPTPPRVPDIAPAPGPVIPTTALGRADFIDGADQAADIFARGSTSGDGPDSMVGRTFSVRLPIGCGGPLAAAETDPPADGRGHVRWDEAGQSLTLSLAPADWVAASPVGDVPTDWEVIEGLWIERPWIRSDTCPALRPEAEGADARADAPSIGLAVVHAEDDSRLGRRNGRPYRHVIRATSGQILIPPAGGWRIRLEGRVVGFPDGRAFRCRATGPDTRPVCVAAVQLDRIAFEDAAGATLSEWRPG